MALVIGSNQMVEMTVPVYEQRQSSFDQYSVPIQTESMHSTKDLKPEFFQSVFLYNESPYVSVRETVYVKKEDENCHHKGVSNI